MNKMKSLYTLEFDKILEMLSQCAMTSGAKVAAMAVSPSLDYRMVQKLQKETTDAKRMTAQSGQPAFGYIDDIPTIAEKADKGAMLLPSELLSVASMLSSVSRLIAYAGKGSAAGSLIEIFGRLLPNAALEHEIRRVVISDDMISDDASPKLYDIRRSIKQAGNKIRDLLQHYITSEAYSKCLQDNIVTMRNGRYVIPVKIEHKNAIKGLIHDTSSSGATVFIEPLSVVEQNNMLRELELAETKEIERILYALSASVAAFGNALVLDYYNITDLALIFARAELSWKMNGTEPIVTENGVINLIKARHPLLPKDKVVPIDIRLGGEFDSLIITGPNTGGKTVSLKTLGLLTLMAQAGFHIPAADGSKVRIFDAVYADIGDEQSIEQSLSTFSAHMTNIVSILKSVDDKSLVLFDELGAGTDPTEGAALAVAIIEKVREKGALSAATTHYTEMKMYAIETEGVCNAACEFDVTTLAPTYKLIIGAPGKSNAFAISSRLGLPEDIITRAGRLVDGDSKRFEGVIEKLEEERSAAEAARREAEQLRADYERRYANAEKEIDRRLKESEKALEKARQEATALLERARATQDFVFAELEKAKKAKESSRTVEEARAEIKKRLKESDEVINPVAEAQSEEYELPRALRKGDEVIIVNLQRKGTLIDTPDAMGNVTVQTGMINTRTNVKNLRLCEDSEVESKGKAARERVVSAKASIARDFKPEIDLRGMIGDEAWEATDKYLDNACLIGIKTVRIIHGKGTGVLRRVIWEKLKVDKRVANFRLGVYGEGDGGVTIAELK